MSKEKSGESFLWFKCLFVLIVLLCVAVFGAQSAQGYEFEQPELVSASAAILVDLNTGFVLYEENADLSLPPASTTKIMTALLVLEAVERGEISLDDEVTASRKAALDVPADASQLKPKIVLGETMTVEQLLYAVMIKSDCAACNILGEHVSGSLDSFIKLMNSRAAELGCTYTNFVNTHGYPSAKHLTTARSLYLISVEALKYDSFKKIVSTVSYTLPPTNKCKEERVIRNSNWLLGNDVSSSDLYSTFYYEGAAGVKTGYSKSSGHCLVSVAERDGRALLCVILGAKAVTRENGSVDTQSYTGTIRLFDYGFKYFSNSIIADPSRIVQSIELSGSDAPLELCCGEELSYLLPSSVSYEELDREIIIFEGLEAPISKGTELGRVKISYKGEQLGETKLVAAQDAELKSDNMIQLLVYNGIIIAILTALGCLIGSVGDKKRKRY